MNNNYDTVSDIYDIYAKFDYDISFYLNRYANYTGKALELMAGSGRISLPLLKHNVALDCVDLSEGLLDKLKEKLIRYHLNSNLYCQNICSLDLPSRYDLVIIGCNSFAEIITKEDRNKVIRSVYDLLNDDGEFIITLHNPPNRRKLIDTRLTHVKSYITDNKTVSFSISSSEDPYSIVHLNQFFEIYDNSGKMVEKKMIKLNFVLLSKDEIEQELLEEGFKIKAIFGNFDCSNYNEVDSQYIIIIATKG